jgi:protein-disulfide isomerase
MDTPSSPVPQEPDRFLPASILVAALLISGSLIYSTRAGKGAPTPSPAAGSENSAPVVVKEVSNSRSRDVILGDENAPVTVVIYGDYQCPFCERLYQGAEQQIRDQYVKTGKVRMIYREFPLDGHPYARPASLAAECAKDQGKFWAFHDALFEQQANLPTMDFAKLAADLGMNRDTFSSCLAAKKYEPEVAASITEGTKFGVTGTPAIFVNGTLISGAQPFATFQSAIEAALQAK